MKAKSKHNCKGSSFDSFLEEEGLLAECTAAAAKKVMSAQLAERMRELKMTKAAMARGMNTSRAQLARLLNPDDESVTLGTMVKAANVLGFRQVRVELID